MKKVPRFSLTLLAGACMCVQSIQAATILYQDDFEANAVGTAVGPPILGTNVDTSTGVFAVNGLQIAASPARDTRSLQVIRDANATGNLSARSLSGAIVDGNMVELKWSLNHEMTHSLNSPMQIGIGYIGSGLALGTATPDMLTYIRISDGTGVNGKYGYAVGPNGPALATIVNNASVVPSKNTPGANEGRWDDLRAVFKFTQIDATHMGGFYDLYANVNGTGEVAVGTNIALYNTAIPAIADPTAMQFRIYKGSSSGVDFYDNISISIVPEPSTMALAAAGLGMFVARRSRR